MSKQDANNDYWNRVGFISFILAVMIVIGHNSSFANYSAPAGITFHRFLHRTIIQIAIPLFFVFSGMNFYRNYAPEKTAEKLMHRVKSLLVPYLAWNTIYCIFALITSNTPISQFFIGREKYAFTVHNLIVGCLFHWYCNGHFWFVFVLIIFALFCVPIYYVVKDRWLGIVSIVVCYIAFYFFRIRLPEIVFYRTESILFYLIGSYLGLHNGLFREKKRVKQNKEKNELIHNAQSSVVTGLILLCFVFLLGIKAYPFVMEPLAVLTGCYGLWLLSEGIMVRNPVIPSGGTTFFIYPAHGILQPVLVKLLYFLLPKASWAGWLNFFLSITLCVFLSIVVRNLLRRNVQLIDEILTGWRR